MSTDFSSIDRLVEFGMGISLARQMVDTMNHAMQNSCVAGVNAGTTGQNAIARTAILSGQPDRQWYAAIDSLQVGPLTEKEVKELFHKRKITEDTLMWRPGLTAWQFAKTIPEINRIILLD